jgi:DNA-binding MarR family transcriptional regulator
LTNQTVVQNSGSVTLPNETALFLRCYPQIYFACHRSHTFDPQARKILSLNQASILDHLESIEPTNLRSLARHMGVTASTMSLNVDRLEAAGYVQRERDPGNARQVQIRLTAAGNRLKQRQSVLDPELVAKFLKRLKGHDRRAALHGLQLLANAAKEMIEDRQASSQHTKSKRNPL